MINEFKKFILRGNLVDLAIGFTVGAAFSTVAKSLVNDIIMPPIGVLLGQSDFSNLFILLKASETVPPPYTSPAAAQQVGAVTLNYGAFINNALSLLVVAVAMFVLIKIMNNLEEGLTVIKGKKETKKKDQPSNKKCPFCYSTIDYRATRCPECTSKLTEPKS